MSNKFLDRLDDNTRERVLKSPFRDFITEYPEEEIRALRAEMTGAASHFSKPQLDALGAVIGFTVEFFYYLKRIDMDSLEAYGVEWVNESTSPAWSSLWRCVKFTESLMVISAAGFREVCHR